MTNLSDKLNEYCKSDAYPYHMPGHKRQLSGAASIDITEIDGFDNLNNPKGIIKDMNDEISRIYDSKKSYFTVNGSTCGNLTAISAVANQGDTILVARNCHRSVINATFIRRINVEYLMPSYYNASVVGAIELSEVKKQVSRLEDKGITPKAVVLTSPTYEGVISDVPSISEYLHDRGVALIVDGAHGAHLHFHEKFPKDFMSEVDIYIMSAHKTLPVLNQGAIIHVNSQLVDEKRVEQFLHMYQSSSPSYVIMESMSNALKLLDEKNIYEKYISKLKVLYEELSKLEALSIEPDSEDRDISKIIIYTNGYMKGDELSDMLRDRYHLEMEMSNPDYVLAMTSCMDTDEGYDRLKKALLEIDENLRGLKPKHQSNGECYTNNHTKVYEYYEVDEFIQSGKCIIIPLDQCVDKVAAETIMAYPPGIPIIVAGEIYNQIDIDYIKRNINNIDINLDKIKVICES